MPGRSNLRARTSGAPAAHEREELLARRHRVAHYAEHGGSHHGGVLLLDAAHHHAQVARLDHHADAPGADRVHHHLRDLLGQALLQLQPAREHVHQPRELAHPEYPALRDIADVAAAEERQHVVLAEAVELDVLHDYHAARRLGEECVVDDLV